jgi:hypothetical protein
MNILLPQNIYTSLIAVTLPENLRSLIKFLPSSSISSILEKDADSVALIPAMDIINHKDLSISKNYGISFESSMCNSYIYYSDNRSLNLLNISGDVSSLEVILSKILFKEMYNSEIEVNLSTSFSRQNNNLLIVGDQNFYNDKLFDGISFSEEIIELLSVPFINFVLASSNEKLIKETEPVLIEKIPAVYDSFNFIEQYYSFSEKMLRYIKQNISSLVLEFGEQDVEGLNQLIRLPYFHGIIKEIIDVKFV